MTDKERKAILAKNPNKRVKKALNNQGRSGDFNGYQGGTGTWKSAKYASRQSRKQEVRKLVESY